MLLGIGLSTDRALVIEKAQLQPNYTLISTQGNLKGESDAAAILPSRMEVSY